jgi:hypothetical protein
VTKAPIAGAGGKLFSGNKSVHSAVSDTQGLFRIDGVAEGKYHVVFNNDAYLRLSPDEPATQPFILSPTKMKVRLHAELVPLGQVAGRVLSPVGEPIKGSP